MNIADAIKIGKKCKRRSWKKKWIDPKDKGHYINLTFDDLVANDWEVEEIRIVVTESVLGAAWVKACKSSGYHDDFAPHGWLYAALKKELGL